MKRLVASIQWDLALVITVTGVSLSIVLQAFPELAGLRIVLGFVLVLVLPGYALSAALFPAIDDVDGVERLALTVGLSIVALPLVGIALHYSWGLSATSVTAALAGVIVVACLLAWLRRHSQPRLTRPLGRHNAPFSRGLVVGLGGFVMALMVIGLVNRPALLTELYVLGREGGMEAYPVTATAGGTVQLEVVIVNREGRTMQYELRAPTASSEFAELVTLNQGEIWRATVTPRVPDSLGRVRFPLELYRTGDQTPYRVIHLYLNIS